MLPQTNEKPWAERVAWTAREHLGLRPWSGAVALELSFCFPRPKKPTVFHPRSDIDKLARSLLDALTGIAYVDDSQVVSLLATKRYDRGDGRIGVEVTVSAAVHL